MSSVLTNSSAISALQSLRSTQAALASTQHRISTGLKVSSAADNASTWAVAETMKSDRGVVSTIADSLGVSSQIINVAMTGVESTISVMNQIKSAVVQSGSVLMAQSGWEIPARSDGDLQKIATTIAGMSGRILEIISSSSFSGINLLDGSISGISLTTGYSDERGSSQSRMDSVTISAQNIWSADVQNGFIYTHGILSGTNVVNDFDFGEPGYFEKLTPGFGASFIFGAMTGTFSGTGFSNWASGVVSSADRAIAALTDYASTLGSTKTTIDSQRDFMRTLGDAMDQGIGSLVDADMNTESTRLQALQTQQQLGVQSLSIANNNNDIVLRLFQ
ncbi:flagellin [Methylosinus sp. PW1]|uniref:flagellin N-terminal helical domain-containing protein n=1 Tax=Methylosinus sp. PW1 TaxID=107636 RepID=UPI000A0759AD|nr:flagellin [Methylosinus sp. PW1]